MDFRITMRYIQAVSETVMDSEEHSNNPLLGFAVITTEAGMTAVHRASRRSADGIQIIAVESEPFVVPSDVERFTINPAQRRLLHRLDLEIDPEVLAEDIEVSIGIIPDGMMRLAEADLKAATAAFEEAGQIEGALAERLNSRSAQIHSASERLRKSLEKTAAQS